MSLNVGELVAYLKLDDDQYNRGLDKAGHRFGGFTSFLKKGALVAGAAIAAGIGTSLVTGFKRLSAIEDAEAKLTGLGHSAGGVKVIMDNALQSVLGTAFGLDEAATTASGAVAAGIKPGKELESTLKLVADAATIGGTSMGEMGAIFNKVAATGKIQGEVLAQLGERGIPIIPLLAKSMGKTAEEVVALASAGEIGFAEFSAAMQEGLGGAAQKSGNTTTGAFKNMMAAVSRFGALMLTGIFPLIGPAFGKITAALDDLGKKAGPALEKVGIALSEWLKSKDAAKIFDDIKSTVKALTPIIVALVTTGFNALVSVLRVLKDNGELVKILVVALAAGFTGYKVVMLALRAATAVATAAQWLWNAAMTANPVGLVVAAIAALIAIFAVLYFKNKTFRELVQKVWGAFKVVVDAVWGAIKAVVGKLGDAWGWIKDHKGGFVKAFDIMFAPILVAIGLVKDLIGVLGDAWDLLKKIGEFGGGEGTPASGGKGGVGIHRALGGPISGPASGYPIIAHARETVVAHKDPSRGLADLLQSGILSTAGGSGDMTLNVNVVVPGGTTLIGTARQVGEIIAPHVSREVRHALQQKGRRRS